MRELTRWVVFGLVAAFPTAASADIISDEEAGCRSKNEGDACKIRDEDGTCAKSTCARNDYSEGAPPKTKQVECLICQPGKPAEEPPEEPSEEPSKEDDAKDDAKPAAAKQTEAKPEKKSGMCSVGGAAPVGLGLVLFAAAGWTRRRR